MQDQNSQSRKCSLATLAKVATVILNLLNAIVNTLK